ncbi:hypothetical protein ACWELO_03030 [Streptomyces sp. NPDC004596]
MCVADSRATTPASAEGAARPSAGNLVPALHGAFRAATDGVLTAAASHGVPEALRSPGLAVVRTGRAPARFACSLLFGAAWTVWGHRAAPAGATAAPAGCAAFSLTLRPGRPPGAPRTPEGTATA